MGCKLVTDLKCGGFFASIPWSGTKITLFNTIAEALSQLEIIELVNGTDIVNRFDKS